MANQATDQKTFLEKVIEKGKLKSANDAQAATKVMFRILRDMMPTSEIEKLEKDLQVEAPKANMEVADLWNDPNVMVAFFSRVSPLRQLNISYDTAMLRLKQEAALTDVNRPEEVALAVMSATKDELSDERIGEIAQYLPNDGFRQMWQQA